MKFGIPVTAREVQLGKPLPWSLHDQRGMLLLKAGHIVQTENQLSVLLRDGLYREKSRVPPARSARVSAASQEPDASPPVAHHFDETGLSVGDVIQVQTLDGAIFRLHYIGFSRHHGILLDYPKLNGGLNPIPEGQGVQLRFFSGRYAYAFKSSVFKCCLSPFPFLMLTYPVAGQGQEIRKKERADVQVIASVQCDGGNYAGQIEDVSVLGARLALKDPLGSVGTEVILTCKVEIAGERTLLQLPATIRSEKRRDDAVAGLSWVYGVEFKELPSDMAVAVCAFVYERLAAAQH